MPFIDNVLITMHVQEVNMELTYDLKSWLTEFVCKQFYIMHVSFKIFNFFNYLSADKLCCEL